MHIFIYVYITLGSLRLAIKNYLNWSKVFSLDKSHELENLEECRR